MHLPTSPVFKKITITGITALILVSTLFFTRNVQAQSPVVTTPLEATIQTLTKIDTQIQTKLEIAQKYMTVAEDINKLYLAALSQKMTKSVARWALTGFKGGDPFFIKDIDQFKQNIAFKKGALALSYLDNSPFKGEITDFAGSGLFSSVSDRLQTALPSGVSAEEWKARLSGESNNLSLSDYATIGAFPEANLTPFDLAFNYASSVFSETEKEIDKTNNQLSQSGGFLGETECIETVDIRGKEVCINEIIKNPSSLVSEKIKSSLITNPNMKLTLDSVGASKEAVAQAIRLASGLVQSASTTSSFIESLSGTTTLPISGGISAEQEAFEAITGTGTGATTADQNAIFGDDNSGFNLQAVMNTRSLDELLYGVKVPLLDVNGNYVEDQNGAIVYATNPGQNTPLRNKEGVIAYIETYQQILQEEELLLSGFATAARDLDQCIPGPDYGYESRLTQVYNTRVGKLSNANSDAKQDRKERFDVIQNFALLWPKKHMDPEIANMTSTVGNSMGYTSGRKRELIDQLSDIQATRAELVAIEDDIRDGFIIGEEDALRIRLVRMINNNRIPDDERIRLAQDTLQASKLRLDLITNTTKKCESYLQRPENHLKHLGSILDIWQCPLAAVDVRNNNLLKKFMAEIMAEAGEGAWPHYNATSIDGGSGYFLGIPRYEATINDPDTVDYGQAVLVDVINTDAELSIVNRGGDTGSTLPPGKITYKVVANGREGFFTVSSRNIAGLNNSNETNTKFVARRVKNSVRGGETELFESPVLKVDCKDYMNANASAYNPLGSYGY